MPLDLSFHPVQSALVPGSGRYPFAMRLLTADTDHDAVYNLRYRAYFAAGHIPADVSGQYSDRHDALMTSALIAAYDGQTCVGTLRVNFSMPWHQASTLPCAPYYPAVRALKREATGGFVEMSRLAVDPEIENRSYRTTLYASLVRAGFMAAQAANVATILIATKPEWVRFYQYMLGFRLVDEPALYPPGDIKISLLGGSLAEAQKRQRAQNAFFRITLDEIASMKAALAPALALPSLPSELKPAAANERR